MFHVKMNKSDQEKMKNAYYSVPELKVMSWNTLYYCIILYITKKAAYPYI